MKKPRCILLAGLLIAVLGGFIWLVLPPPEPIYDGETLSFWLQGYNYSEGQNLLYIYPRGPSPTWGEADEAVRQVGTKAIPTLLQILQERDSKLKVRILIKLRILSPLSIQHFFKIPISSSKRNMAALSAFSVLGPEASNAVPRLIKIFETDPDPFPQQAVPVILGYIGPAAEAAIPALLRGITHTNRIVRNDAIFALWRIHAKPELVVPALLRCLVDPDPLVRAQAARALGAFGKDSQPAVPALLESMRREPSRSNSRWLEVFLDNTIVGSSWASPPLAFSRDAPDVGELAKQALQSIDPASLSEAAAKAGVK